MPSMNEINIFKGILIIPYIIVVGKKDLTFAGRQLHFGCVSLLKIIKK